MLQERADTPLHLFFNIWATVCVAGFHVFLMVALLGPNKSITVVGVPIGVGALFLVIAYSWLKILFEVYGLAVASRLALVGIGMFAFALVIVVILAYLPTTVGTPRPVLAVDRLIRALIGIIVGFAAANGFIVLMFQIDHRGTSGWKLWMNTLFAPIIAYIVTVFVTIAIYYGPFGVSSSMWIRTSKQALVVIAFVIAYSPLVYWTIKYIRSRELYHQALLIASFIQQARLIEQEKTSNGDPV